jgi:nitroimidazol reductase NimA-like FMN-containing flavoprotein (pyridoxamine 5'-phosphate oxidase superfamily)
MAEPYELTPELCGELLRAGVVGRIALATPTGPHLVPINYSVVDDSIVLRTSPYSVLGRHGLNARVAFEIDHFDHEYWTGWSVVAHGTTEAIVDPAEFDHIRTTWEPKPWAGGPARNLYLRLAWTELTGRLLGSGSNLLDGLETRRRIG